MIDKFINILTLIISWIIICVIVGIATFLFGIEFELSVVNRIFVCGLILNFICWKE